PPGKRPRKPVIGTGVAVIDPGPPGTGPRRPGAAATLAQRGGIYLPPLNEPRYVKDEVLLEFRGQVSLQVSRAIITRNRLTQLESIYLPLTNTTVSRLKITDGRSVPAVLNQLGREVRIDFRQPNFIFRTAQEQGAGATGTKDTDAKAGAMPEAGAP